MRPTRAARGNGWRAAIARQPEPKIPGISKEMVRQHLPKLIERGVLKRKPTSVSDWLLAEWHLAKELKVSPIRLAFFVSEVLTEPEGFRQVSPFLAASR